LVNPEWIAAGPKWRDAAEHEALARRFLFHDCRRDDPWPFSTIRLLDTTAAAAERLDFTWRTVPID
jgi:hypothetical protein